MLGAEAMTLTIGSRVEVWERQRLCYVGVITAKDKHDFQVRHAASVTASVFYRDGRRLQYDNSKRYLKAVQS